MAETFIAAKKDGLQIAINVGCGRHAVEIRFEADMDDASDPSAGRERGLNENEAVALAEQILRAFVPDRLVETAVSKFLNTLIDRPDIKAEMGRIDMTDIPFNVGEPALVYSRDDLKDAPFVEWDGGSEDDRLEHDTDADGVPATAYGPYAPLDIAFEEHAREADKDVTGIATHVTTLQELDEQLEQRRSQGALSHGGGSSTLGQKKNVLSQGYEVAYSGRRGAGRVVGRVAIGGYDVVSPQPDIYAEAARHLQRPITINEEAHGHNESAEITLDEWAKR